MRNRMPSPPARDGSLLTIARVHGGRGVSRTPTAAASPRDTDTSTCSDGGAGTILYTGTEPPLVIDNHTCTICTPYVHYIRTLSIHHRYTIYVHYPYTIGTDPSLVIDNGGMANSAATVVADGKPSFALADLRISNGARLGVPRGLYVLEATRDIRLEGVVWPAYIIVSYVTCRTRVSYVTCRTQVSYVTCRTRVSHAHLGTFTPITHTNTYRLKARRWLYQTLEHSALDGSYFSKVLLCTHGVRIWCTHGVHIVTAVTSPRFHCVGRWRGSSYCEGGVIDRRCSITTFKPSISRSELLCNHAGRNQNIWKSDR